jgi:histidinol-phosphatase (PHP family)
MRREKEDFYPEEQDAFYTEEGLAEMSDKFIAEALRLRKVYSGKIRIPIGFESEWIRPTTLGLIRELSAKHEFDFFLGSLHHVHTIPIDFDKPTYLRARTRAGGTDEALFKDYFDSQFEMLQALQPPVVGHFDLIRLLSEEPDDEFKSHEAVWEKIRRNLEYIASYGGILELNSSALRKGLAQPHPCKSVCKTFLSLGGRFTMSDDSHSIDQIGTNYPRLLEFVKETGIQELHYATEAPQNLDRQANTWRFTSMSVDEVSKLPFWVAEQ